MSSSHQLPPLLNQPAVNTESGNTNGCPRRSDLLRQLESPTQATGLPNGSASSLQTPGLQDSRRGSLSSVHNIPSDRPEPEQLRTPRLSFHLNASVQPLPNGTRSDTTEDHLRQLLPPVRSLETIRRRSSRDLPPQPASNLSQYDVFSNNWTTNLAPPDERLPPFSTVVPRPSTIPRLDTQSHQTSTQSQSSLNHILSASSAPSDQQRVMELTGTPNYKRSWSDRQMHQNAIRRSLEMYDMSGIMDDLVRGGNALSTFGRHYRNQFHESQFRSNSKPVFPTLEECEQMLALQQKTIDSLLRIREQHLLQPAAHEPPPPPFKAPEPDFGAPNESQIHGEMIMNGPLANDIKKRRGRAAPPGRCHSCNRAETPEWRRGPDGARTLCNACGLHYAKLSRKNALKSVSVTSGLLPMADSDDISVE